MVALETKWQRWSASAQAFPRFAWPAIGPLIGGGRLVNVEGADVLTEVHETLDILGGVDYIQVDPDDVPFGIASRVQFTDAPYDTFTLRRTLASGRLTELARRLVSYERIHHEPIGPRWFVQSYVSLSDPQRLLSAAAIPMKYLLAQYLCGRPGQSWYVNAPGAGDAEFVYMRWSEFPSYWAPIVWREGLL